MKRYVWIDSKGRFSNSWSEEEHREFIVDKESIRLSVEKGWKLIEYECLNDPKFEFYNMMRLA
jgi:hypothetical protein